MTLERAMNERLHIEITQAIRNRMLRTCNNLADAEKRRVYAETVTHLDYVIELLCDWPDCKELQQRVSAARQQKKF